MQILYANRRRRWHLWSHVWALIRNRSRKLFAWVGVAACVAFVVWSFTGFRVPS